MLKSPGALIALRAAAMAWTRGLSEPVLDSRDSAFVRLDRRLQRAAVTFAKRSGGSPPDRGLHHLGTQRRGRRPKRRSIHP
jgi:hypothetical protein